MNAQLASPTLRSDTAKNAESTSGLLQRKCSCGGNAGFSGECESCRKKKLLGDTPPLVQPKLKIGAPNDRYEQEADRVADQVMRMPVPGTGSPPGVEWSVADHVQAKPLVQLKATHSSSGLHEAPSNVSGVLRSPGRPLDAATRGFMEPRFGYDFSQVRVHADARASASAREVNARAYTVGHDIVFDSNQYSPTTTSGRQLLAHELTHVVQQGTGRRRGLQRLLAVNPKPPSFAPSNDPAASMSKFQRLSDMDQLIQALCENFKVDKGTSANPGTGQVRAKSAKSANERAAQDQVRKNKRIGCCCLSVLVNASSKWVIHVSQLDGPHTLRLSNAIVLSPLSSPIEFGFFTAGGSRVFPSRDDEVAAGHEICGHAALMEIGAHPPPLGTSSRPVAQDRTKTDVHDPTVNIENQIANEQGVPASQRRGLARSGLHRGESVDRITIGPYPFNGLWVTRSLRSQVRFAARYIIANNSWVDIFGHSDPVGSAGAKQRVSQKRADNMKIALNGMGVTDRFTKPRRGIRLAARFTRVEGLSDTQPPKNPADHANWRRVELIIAGLPAGTQDPARAQISPRPVTPPPPTTPHVRNPNLPALRKSPDPCVVALVEAAYPP